METEELPRCSTPKFSDKLDNLVKDIHAKFNDESETHKLTVVLSFNRRIPIISHEERHHVEDFLKLGNPETLEYLEANNINYLPLGFTTGQIVAYPTLKQLENFQTSEVKEIDLAPNEFDAYLRILKKK